MGRSTLSISLPREWIGLAGVRAGDEVYLEQGKDGILRILSENLVRGEAKPKEYSINSDQVKEPSLLERLIVGSYIEGADQIRIFSPTRINGGQIEEIRNIVRRLIGLSITNISREEITLQCFIDPSKFKINSLIQRLSVVASTMLGEAMGALLELDTETANDVIEMENEANNIFWLIKRLTFSSLRSPKLADDMGLNEPFDPTDVRMVSKNLEGIADCSVSIARVALDLHRITHDERIVENLNTKELEEMPSITQLMKEVLQKSTDALFSRDLLAANNAIDMQRKLDAKIEALMRMSTIPYFPAIAVMLGIIGENCASIASVAFDLEVKRSQHFPHQLD